MARVCRKSSSSTRPSLAPLHTICPRPGTHPRVSFVFHVCLCVCFLVAVAGTLLAPQLQECAAELAPQLQAALLGMIGKPVQEFVHVDVGEKLAELGLDKFFPVEARAHSPPVFLLSPPSLVPLPRYLVSSVFVFVCFVFLCRRRGHHRTLCESWHRS